ncbi:MAG: aminotransferase class V-fold PLP-dependent enzyme [Rhodobacteraceae bacterium]|nr:aminotransferase class V-fold PLP-dependent enzyme [Paracoccaceae bacterium]
MSDVMKRWGLTPVINASGTMTTLGASRVSAEVRAAVDDILGRFVRIDELHALANRAIRTATGAEAGYVTSSSSAAITLACAAAMAGDDPAAIEALPTTKGQRRVAVMMSHMVNYGGPVPQAISASGAEVVPLGTAALCETYHLEAAIAEGLAAAVYVVSHHTVREGELPMDLFVSICRANGVPVIVDMAAEYDLTGPVALGADAVIWSGHKFLGGTTSGIVAGRAAMIRAMILQNRGLGRLMKAGKEAIVGAVAALEAWGRRDHAAEAVREAAIVDRWIADLAGLPGVTARRHGDWTGNPVTRVRLKLSPEAGLHAWELASRAMAGNPAIALRDDLSMHQLIFLDPCNVTAQEAPLVSARIREVCEVARQSGDGLKRSWSEEKASRGHAGTPWIGSGDA